VKKIGSHSYILLELIIGLLLVTLCVLPFVRIPSGVVREEMLFIQRLEMQHMSDRALALIKERIYTKEISWEQLCHPREKKTLVIEDVISLPVKELAKQRYSRKCYLYSVGKKGQNNEEYRLVTVIVAFKKIPSKLGFFSNKKKKVMWFTSQFFIKLEKDKIEGIAKLHSALRSSNLHYEASCNSLIVLDFL